MRRREEERREEKRQKVMRLSDCLERTHKNKNLSSEY